MKQEQTTKREYGKALTRKMLKEWGITQVDYDLENDEWWINRYWYYKNSKEKKNVRIKVSNAVCKHKYSSDKSYPIVSFSYKQKVITLPLARIVYVWYRDDIDEKEVIDHIDNNPYNNQPKNLQKLSVGENLAKRYINNPNASCNQYETELYKMVHAMFEAGISYEDAIVAIAKFKKEN